LPSLKRLQQKYRTKNIHYDTINRVRLYIINHLFDKLDADSLAEIANLSKYYFLRLFKEITGERLFTYILRLRLEYIAHMLITTDLSLSQIILQGMHYESKHSLSKAFKKYFGISPSEYRMMHFQSDDLSKDINQGISENDNMAVLTNTETDNLRTGIHKYANKYIEYEESF